MFPSLYVNCHHQIILPKLNLNVVYPPPYKKISISKSLNSVDWDFFLSNKNVHQQAQHLNKVLVNVFSNYIPNKLITIDDKDPTWMNDDE